MIHQDHDKFIDEDVMSVVSTPVFVRLKSRCNQGSVRRKKSCSQGGGIDRTKSSHPDPELGDSVIMYCVTEMNPSPFALE